MKGRRSPTRNIGAMPGNVAMEASHKGRLSDAAGLRGVEIYSSDQT